MSCAHGDVVRVVIPFPRWGSGLHLDGFRGGCGGLAFQLCLHQALRFGLGSALGPALRLVECLLAGLATALDSGGGWPQVDGGFAVDALGLERAVVNAGGVARAGQCVVGQLCPALTPARDLCGAGRTVSAFDSIAA